MIDSKELPKQYNFQENELQARSFWADQEIYRRDENGGPLYSIDTPPPTVSGSLHIGHVFSYTQTDIVARYKRLKGLSVFYPFGFDNNGLPTERFVEKKCEVKAQEVGRSAFIALCLKEAGAAEEQFKKLWQHLGISADWKNTYSTISDSTRKISQESFIRLFEKGFAYRHQELALFCTVCQTSVAQAELEDKELPSTFNTIIFKDAQGNDLYIATTRPELLPACVAVLYHPEDDRYRHLKGTEARVPLFEMTVPLLSDESVDPDKGTGLVMVCTFGDKKDAEWYKKFNLPYKKLIGSNGRFTSVGGFLEGLSAKQARVKVVEELLFAQLLVSQKEIMHAVNVHERCKAPIEFIIIPQWFISVIKHKETFLKLGDEINWYPSFMKARYKDWVENLGWDWGISRQRFFGIPFPAWHCQDCQMVILADKEQLPIDPQETTYKGNCPECGGSRIEPDTDVMDTWNTSSLTPYICRALFEKSDDNLFEKSGSFVPMSMRPQAHDIIRTWAFDTIVKVWMHQETVPWRDIVISGHVLSDQNKKLSKSQEGKAVTPERLIAEYPADAIRYWTASAKLGMDVAFTENQLKIANRLITKLWNAFRFAEPHIVSVDPQKFPEKLGMVNEWILQSLTTAFVRYEEYLDQNEFGLALEPIESFFWNDFCDNYVELVKNQLFNPALYSEAEVAATRWTLHHVGLRILQLYAPYLPFVTETIYQHMFATTCGINSLHKTTFSSLQIRFEFVGSYQEGCHIVALVSAVRKLKTTQQISLKTPLVSLMVFLDEKNILLIEKHKQLILGTTQAESLSAQSKYDGLVDEIINQNGLWHAKIIL